MNWDRCINEMSSLQTFEELQAYINSNLLPEFVCEPKYTMSAEEMEKLDWLHCIMYPMIPQEMSALLKLKAMGIASHGQSVTFCIKLKTIIWK